VLNYLARGNEGLRQDEAKATVWGCRPKAVDHRHWRLQICLRLPHAERQRGIR